MSEPGTRYLDVVKDQLHLMGEELLMEDIDILCKYVVLRFLKSSVQVHNGVSQEEIAEKLQKFVQDIYPFLVTFVTIVNSGSVQKKGDA